MAVSRSFELFGGSISFKRTSIYVLSTIFSNITNEFGKTLSLEEIDSVKNTEDYGLISVNGQLLRRAKITGFDFGVGIFNKSAKVKITLLVQEDSEDLTALSGYYSDYASAFLGVCALVDEITESINLSRGENSLDFNKSINIKFSNSVLLIGPENPVVRQAQVFAKAIFDYDVYDYDTIPDLQSELSIRDILGLGFKKFTNETINTITNQCSFTQSLNAENIKEDGSLKYSHSATQTISIKQNGIVEVSEQGSIKALTGFYDTQGDKAEEAYQNELENIDIEKNTRKRLQDIFDEYSRCSDDLKKVGGRILYISISKTIDRYRGTISYTVSANNDKKNENADESVVYIRTLSYSISNGDWLAIENGKVEGLSKTNYNSEGTGLEKFPKFLEAYTFYRNITASDIRGRLTAFMTEIGATKDLSPLAISRSENHQPLKGTVEYERKYSTEKVYEENDQWKQVRDSDGISYEYLKNNPFTIINKPILLQPTVGNIGVERGSQDISVNIKGYRINPSLKRSKFQQILQKAEEIVSDKISSEEKINFVEKASAKYKYLNGEELDISVSAARGMDSYE